MAKEVKPVKEVIKEVVSEDATIEITLKHKTVGTHTIYTADGTVIFEDGKATVSAELAKSLKASGYVN